MEEWSKKDWGKFLFLIEDIVLLSIVWIAVLNVELVAYFVNVMTDIEILALGFVNSLIVVIGAYFCLKIEEKVGSYVCKHCGCRHKPSFKKILLAMHIGRTRYLSCPVCDKMSWQKKEI